MVQAQAPVSSSTETTDSISSSDATTTSDPISAPPSLTQKLQQAGVDHEIALMRHGEDVFRWQLWSSKIIFWIVNALVLAGIAFAAIQFGVGLARREIAEAEEAQLSFEGLKVKSRFLGVITLTISLAFFYLYLKTVYPIRPINTTQAATTTTQHP